MTALCRYRMVVRHSVARLSSADRERGESNHRFIARQIADRAGEIDAKRQPHLAEDAFISGHPRRCAHGAVRLPLDADNPATNAPNDARVRSLGNVWS